MRSGINSTSTAMASIRAAMNFRESGIDSVLVAVDGGRSASCPASTLRRHGADAFDMLLDSERNGRRRGNNRSAGVQASISAASINGSCRP